MFHFSNKKALGQGFTCCVQLLVPGEQMDIGYSQHSTGQDILNEVVSKLELLDKNYYGLRLHSQIQWIDLSKPIVKQTKGIDNVVLDLRFKYYPTTPALLANESTRYYLYLQLRLDLLEGRIRTEDQETLAFLIACILQSELGDYNQGLTNDEHKNYVSEFKFIPNQTEELELEAIELHKNDDFQGLKPSESELNFLKKASQLDMYGIDPFPVRCGSSRDYLLIGVNHLGISTFQNTKKVTQFFWAEIDRIALDNRMVLIYCKRLDKKGVKKKPLFGFCCPSQEHAHCFWKIATEHRYFFTLESTPETPIVTMSGGLFRKTHKVRYSDRVEKDLLRDEDSFANSNRTPLKRSHSLLSKSSEKGIWQGFEQGKDLQTSLDNIYANDLINKTMPSNLGCFREEDEDRLAKDNLGQQLSTTSKNRSSISSFDNNEGSQQFSGRKPNLMNKNDYQTSANEKDIKLLKQLPTNNNHEIVKITVFLIGVVLVAFFAILLVDEGHRPDSLNILIRKTSMEPASRIFKDRLFRPVKTTLKKMLG